MMRFPIALVPAILILSGSFAQSDFTPVSAPVSQYNPGIYMSFREFLNNAPTGTEKFIATRDSATNRLEIHFTTRKKAKNAFGFSDGKDRFISADHYVGINYFVKVELAGPIFWFEDELGKARYLVNRGYVPGYSPGGMLEAKAVLYAGKNPVWIMYAGDEEGQPYILDSVNLISIFKESDLELLKLFKQEKDLEDLSILQHYVILYNERHPRP